MDIELSLSEILLAGQAGVSRQVAAIKDRRKQPSCAPAAKPDWQHHCVGAVAEMALAKSLNIFWSGTIGEIDKADVGDDLEIRSTSYATGELPIKPEDKPHSIYVLALTNRLHSNRVVRLVGWMRASEAMKRYPCSDKKGTGWPAHWVPQADLYPMEELRNVVTAGGV